ncbi:MAG TPA: AbrB family transcriptional regulator [Ruminococcaceae bacterium]|nr:AbrB family transcriptional regulator [Oscillospiraceae bacterium]HBG55985.1 AbrB family transcriptional regulator [Oscillospiraceae bacterium]HBQ45702.1 AbrB family transcriptional regulator [Oscillospiraceae bacterium]HBT90762.1 AbrB family transcriptional regulator [Oscillospiraceae bacterium]HCB90836.1 AbrB family transcriptional regulator [Oscillospiraceae bacterium]
MKFTGIVRKVDELGRIVLPKELRVTLNINEKDPLEIYVDEDDKIVLKKYEPACIFCGGMNGIINYKGRNICQDCLKQLAGKYREEKRDSKAKD